MAVSPMNTFGDYTFPFFLFCSGFLVFLLTPAILGAQQGNDRPIPSEDPLKKLKESEEFRKLEPGTQKRLEEVYKSARKKAKQSDEPTFFESISENAPEGYPHPFSTNDILLIGVIIAFLLLMSAKSPVGSGKIPKFR